MHSTLKSPAVLSLVLDIFSESYGPWFVFEVNLAGKAGLHRVTI